VAGATAADIEAETAWLVEVIEAELASGPALPAGMPAEPAPALVEAVAAGLGRPSVLFSPDPLVLALAADPAGRAFLEGGPLIPDQIVYAGSFPLILEPASADNVAAVTASAVAAFAAARGAAPIVAIVPGTGLFATGDTAAQAATARDVYLDMLRTGATALRLGGVRHLDARERTFIEHWEAEAYRKQVAAAG
jgi:rhamnulokinase